MKCNKIRLSEVVQCLEILYVEINYESRRDICPRKKWVNLHPKYNEYLKVKCCKCYDLLYYFGINNIM